MKRTKITRIDESLARKQGTCYTCGKPIYEGDVMVTCPVKDVIALKGVRPSMLQKRAKLHQDCFGVAFSPASLRKSKRKPK